MTGKEAVVFLLDAHPSMNAPYPSNGASSTTSTRLSCAKEALEGMISQLMIQSKQNEVGVIVLNTEAVKSEDGWGTNPHMTELSLPCVTRPSVELLQTVRRVKCASRNFHGGDVCKGLLMAEKGLRQRTFKKEFARRLVVFTDAAHNVDSSHKDIRQVIDKLRELDCTLTVIGVDFERSVQFEEPLAAEQAAVKDKGEEDYENDDGDKADSDESNDTTEGESMDEEEDDEEYPLTFKRENEELLISIARLTGGSIIAASTMKEIAESTLGKRIPKSAKKKIQFHIAPGLKLEAKCSLLLSRAPFPSLKKDAVLLDESGQPKVDGNDEVISHKIVHDTIHWDPDNKDMEVSPENRTSAFRYGADLIPMSSLDNVGLKLTLSDPAIRILGYTQQSIVPRSIMIGPPYTVTGGDSHRVCCTIAALSQALQRLDKVAICTYVKSKQADPMLGALFPLLEENTSQPTRLFFIQIPFADDVKKFNKGILEASLEDSPESRACDNLIDSMMLSPETLRSEQIANPAIRAFRKTIKNRAIDPSSTAIISARDHQSGDQMSTPNEVLERSASSLEAFRKTFPRKRVLEPDGKNKKKARYWTEHGASQDKKATL
jgi:hypothetical protein